MCRPQFTPSRPFHPSSSLDRLVEEVGYLLLSPTIVEHGPVPVLDDEDLLKRTACELGIGSKEAYWRVRNACFELPKGVNELPANLAAGLRGWARLDFPNLTALSYHSARALVPLQRGTGNVRVKLPEVKTLEPRALAELASFAQFFTLGIPEVSVAHAMALQEWGIRQRRYDFQIERIARGGAAAEVLFWNREVWLDLQSLPDLATIHSIVEARQQATSVLSMRTSSDEDPSSLIQALASFRGGLRVLNFADIPAKAADALTALSAFHLVIGAEYLDKQSARTLSFSNASHLVLGTEGLEPGALESLLAYQGPLLIWGVESLTDRELDLLAEREFPISLPCVASLSDGQALKLRNSVAPIEFGKHTKLSRRMRHLLNENGYGSMSFPKGGPRLVPVVPAELLYNV